MVKNKHNSSNRNNSLVCWDALSGYELAIKSSCLLVDRLPCLSHNPAASHHVITNSVVFEACCRFRVSYMTFAKCHSLDKKLVIPL